MNMMARLLRTLGKVIWQIVYQTLNAIYKTITRTALYAITLALVGYFVVNSSLGRQAILDGINDGIPGTCSADNIQWGPLPWKVSLLNVNIRDPRGVTIIAAEQVHADFDFAPFGDYLSRKVIGREAPLPIIFDNAIVNDADVLVRSDEGWMGIKEAFTDGKPSETTGPGTHVIIRHITVNDTSTELDFSGFSAQLHGIDILADLKVIDGKLDIQGQQVNVNRGDLWFPSVVVDSKALHVPIADFHASSTQVTKTHVGIGHAKTKASTLDLELRGNVNTGLPTVAIDASAHVALSLSDPVVQSLTRFPLSGDGDLIVQAHGPVNELQLDANMETEQLWADGLGLGAANISMSLAPPEAMNTDGLVLHVSPLALDTLGGSIFIDEFMVAPGTEQYPELHMGTTMRLYDVNPSLAWALESLQNVPLPPQFLDGVLNGDLSVHATKTPIDNDFSSWALQNSMRLQHSWAGTNGSLLQPEFGAQGQATVIFGADETSIQTDGLHLYSGRDHAKINGHIDLAAQNLELGLNGRLHLKHLNPLMPEGYENLLAGKARLEKVKISGLFSDPTISARIQTDRLRIQTDPPLDIGRVTTSVQLQNGTLQSNNIRITSPLATVRTGLSLGLWRGEMSNIHSTLPLRLKNLRIDDLDLSKWTDKYIKGHLAIRSKRFQMDLGASNLKPRGAATISSNDLTVGGERFQHASTQIKVSPKTLAIDQLKAHTRAGAKLIAKGSWNWDTDRVMMKLAANQIDLSRLQAIKGAKLPARGTIDLTFQGKGRLDRLAFDGSINTRAFGWGGVELGAASIDFKRKKGDSLVHLDSSNFFPSLSLHLGRLELDRAGRPSRLTIAANSKKTDLLSLLPALSDTFDSAILDAGNIHFDLFFRGQTNSVITVEVPGKGLNIAFANGSGTLTNTSELWTRMIDDTIVVDPTILGLDNHRLAVCGFMGPSDRIQLDVAGSVDLGSIPGITKMLADANGQLITHASEPDNDSFEESCLLEIADESTLSTIGSPTGVLFLRNRLENLSIDGALRANKLWIATRGQRQELTVDSGVILLKTESNDTKTPSIEIQKDAPLVGTLDDRQFVLTGQMQLVASDDRKTVAGWIPDSGQFHMVGKQDFEWVSADGYELAFLPNLTLDFDGIQSKPQNKRKLSLKGDINVTQGTVFKSFNRFAQAFSNMLGRTVELESGSLVESFPLLNEMMLNLKIHGNNMRIKSEFGLGGIDVDSRFNLTATETLGRPEINGWLEVTEGTITYNVVKREFSITDGKLEFSGDPLEPEINVTAESIIERSVSSDNANLAYSGEDENIVVTIKVTGTPSSMDDITLESRPSYSPLDLQWLILTGRTKSEFEDRSFQGDPAALNLLGANLAEWMTGVLRAPFIRSVEIAPLVGGGGQLEVSTRLGKAIRLDTTVRQEHGDTSYHAGFRFKINDRLSLEGRLRGAGEDTDGRQTYETKVKYSIPLD